MSKYGITNFDRGLDLGRTIAEGHAQAEIDQLKEENAALREERDTYRTQLVDVTESMGRVEERCAGLREACAELLEMAESLDPDWLHWPEMYEELRGLGVEV